MSNIRDFGAKGDGQADDTDAFRHALAMGDGVLNVPPGDYKLTGTIEVDLTKAKRFALVGAGGTPKLIMAGAGPMFRVIGTHGGTGDPTSFKPEIFQRERLPTFQNLEIEGQHAEADGIELIGTVQTTLEGMLIRQVRHGVRVFKRNRNVLISHCHIYNNTGIGVFLDRVNLHQINIVGSHISYNRLGGIRIEGSEIRNLQITGCDIEYNNHRAHKTEPAPTAEIHIDFSLPGTSVEEVTICSNTIQATVSPGGANVRIIGNPKSDRPLGLMTITGNIIGNQETSVHVTACNGIIFSGNIIYSSELRNVLFEKCGQMTLAGNTFRRHTPRLNAGVRLVDCVDTIVSGCSFQDLSEEGQVTKASLLEMVRCQRVTVQGSQFLDGVPYGLLAEDCGQLNISSCTVVDTRAQRKMLAAVRFVGTGQHNLLSACTLGAGTEGVVQVDEKTELRQVDNVNVG